MKRSSKKQVSAVVSVAKKVESKFDSRNSFVREAIIDLDILSRGVVGLSGMVAGFSLVVVPFVLLGAVSRFLEEISTLRSS